MKKFFGILGIILAGLLGAILLFLLVLFGYWYLRPNRAHVDPQVVVESWDVANDKMHNSNTDLVAFQGKMYLAYVSSPYHFGNDNSLLHVKVSTDMGHTWREVRTFNPANEDIRDPKFAVIGDRLFLYALKNTTFVAEPYNSVYSFTTDGNTWTDFQSVPGLDGWLFWRPKSQDGITFYNAAYWYEHGKSILIKSTDGIHWEIVSYIHQGDHNDETEIEFLPDGRLLAIARLEYDSFGDGMFGHPLGATLITLSESPYTEWSDQIQSRVTRLDGPCLFSYEGRVFAMGRFQPDLESSGPLTDQGSILARKRTSLFEVRTDGLTYLTDLPSAGDTSYVGLIMDRDVAYASYYTSPINHDYAWILGMLSPSQVRMAKIDLKAMVKLADQTPAK